MVLVDRRVDELRDIENKLRGTASVSQSFRLMYKRDRLKRELDTAAREINRYVRGWVFMPPNIAGKA